MRRVAGPTELDRGLAARSKDGPWDADLVPILSATGPLDEDRPVRRRSWPGPAEQARDPRPRSGVGARDDAKTRSCGRPLDNDLTADDRSSTPVLDGGLITPDLSSAGPRDVDRRRGGAYLSEYASRAREERSIAAGCEGIVASGLSMRGSSAKLSTQYGVAGIGSRRMIGLVYCPGGLGLCRTTGSIEACCTGLCPLSKGGLCSLSKGGLCSLNNGELCSLSNGGLGVLLITSLT
jgi:hypothetical protein